MFEAASCVGNSSVPLPNFVAGQSATQVDGCLRQALAVADRAQECAVLWFAEVARRSLFRELGHASLELYAINGLGFSRNRYFQFKRLTDDLERLPRLRAAVAAGRIGWTKAQQVARVATPASEAVWVNEAASTGRREFVEAVKKARANVRARRRGGAESSGDQLLLPVAEPADDGGHVAAAPPVTVSFRLDGIQYAQFEALIERIRKRGVIERGATREEILLAALEFLSESGAPGADDAGPTHELRRRNSGPPVQVVLRRCPECEATAVITSRGDRQLSRADAEAALCDARIVDGSGRTHATVPPSVRAAVLARDGHRCRDCGSRNFLHVHHMVPRSEGGSNKPENLVTLCSRCHRFSHETTDAVLGSVAFHRRR